MMTAAARLVSDALSLRSRPGLSDVETWGPLWQHKMDRRGEIRMHLCGGQAAGQIGYQKDGIEGVRYGQLPNA